MKKILLLILLLSINSASFAEYRDSHAGKVTEGDVVVDLFLARPLGLVGSVLGLGIHGIGLLFSVPGGNYAEVGEVLVEEPLNYTFNRPLGHFEEQ